ncbi:TIGR04222 domain-containing membrane protein [Streptomyces sp. BI20]|uniref:TIGR04222 domain-containing membrane protein n=1 Tax=Streptomyces sp. BI20 TaxID=3403460 RepID=UPI003C72FCB7
MSTAASVLTLLLVGAIVGSRTLLLRLRVRSLPVPPSGADSWVRDRHEAAFLSGGPGRVVDATVAALVEAGSARVAAPGVLTVAGGARGRDAVEAAVLEAWRTSFGGSLSEVRQAAVRTPAVQGVGDGLAARGLLLPAAWGRPWRRWAAVHVVVCLLLLPVALLSFVAVVVGTDTSPLFGLFLFGGLITGLVWGIADSRVARRRLSPAGAEALRAAEPPRGAPVDFGTLVSFLGTGALPDPALRDALAGARREASRARRAAAGAGVGAAVGLAVADVSWCGTAGNDGCGGSSCGGSDGGSGGGGCGGASGCGSSSGSSCGSSGSSCGGGGGGSSCGGSS